MRCNRYDNEPGITVRPKSSPAAFGRAIPQNDPRRWRPTLRPTRALGASKDASRLARNPTPPSNHHGFDHERSVVFEPRTESRECCGHFRSATVRLAARPHSAPGQILERSGGYLRVRWELQHEKTSLLAECTRFDV